MKEDLREMLSPEQRTLLERTVNGLGLGGKLTRVSDERRTVPAPVLVNGGFLEGEGNA